jgi:hypothetical protein
MDGNYIAGRPPSASSGHDLYSPDGYEVRKHPDGEAWVVEATNKPPTSAEKMDEIRDEMEVLAAQFGGDYDGWEVAVNSLRDAGGRKIH